MIKYLLHNDFEVGKLSKYNIKLLIHIAYHEGDIKAVNNNGDNILMMALKAKNDINMIRFLLNLDINLAKVFSYIRWGKSYDLSMIIEECLNESLDNQEYKDYPRSIDINAKNSQGETALMIAARNYTDLEFVKSLLEAGAYVWAVDNNGNTAYQIAKEYNPNPAIAEFLKEYEEKNRCDMVLYNSMLPMKL